MTSVTTPTSTRRSIATAVNNSTLINIIGLLAAIILLYVILSLTATGFLNVNNQLGLLRQAAIIGITATGMTLVIIAGEIDVSVGPAVALSSVIVAQSITAWHIPTVFAIVLTLAIATGWGTVAGLLRAKYAVPSFIATLGLWSVLRGFGQFWTNALPVPLPDGDPIMDVLNGSLLGVPTPAWAMIVAFLVFGFIARRTAYGRSVFATGGNPAAARLAGINVPRVRILIFSTMGLLAAVSGIFLAARLGSGNAGAANGLEFDVIAAVVIGGTAMAGGRGSLLGSFLGVLFITLIGNGLVLLGVNSFLQDVIRGVIIVAAVLLNVTLSRARSARKEDL